jgi:hypothetical protein
LYKLRKLEKTSMARKSAAAVKEPASLPEVPLPLSSVPENQRAAYELEVIDDPEMFRKILSTEDFFQMIADFPQAWWGDRLTMYLYRHESDDGIMVKNPQGEGNYIKPVIRQAVDRDWIANRNGGGKFCLWLNLSSPNPANPDRRISTTVRKYTFRIDGPPLVKEGQVVEVGGRPVSVAGAAPVTGAPVASETAQIVAATSDAAKANAEILTAGMKSVMDIQSDLTRRNLGLDGKTEKDPIELAIKLVELLRPAPVVAPAADPVQARLMEKIIDRAFAEPKENHEPERPETKLEEISSVVETFTGKSLADLAKGAKVVAPDNEFAWVAPVASLGQQLIVALPTIIQQWRQARHEEFERALYVRSTQAVVPGAPAPPGTTTTALAPPAGPRPVPPQQPAAQPPANQPPDRATIVQAIVARICQGFDKHRDGGYDVAAAISVEFGEFIESMGLETVLTDQEEMQAELMKYPQLAAALAQRTIDARWPEYIEPLADYMEERWGEIAKARKAEAEQKPGPQAVPSTEPPAA